MIGTTVGKYRIVALLGRGATGIVYRALDDTLDREVAIKVLNPLYADGDILKRFRSEATTLARLSHPEIATIHELLRTDTNLLMVMELVRGETLEGLAKRKGALSPDLAGHILDGILSALEHAHDAGIVHRDLKPANVMITALGGIKIMDFGIARVRGAEHMTLDGCAVGTPAYMAPEQVLVRKSMDGPTCTPSVSSCIGCSREGCPSVRTRRSPCYRSKSRKYRRRCMFTDRICLNGAMPSSNGHWRSPPQTDSRQPESFVRQSGVR